MNKKILCILLFFIVIFSVTSVNAADNMTFSEDNNHLQANEYDSEYYDEIDAYIAGFYDNQSTVVLDPASVNLNVKNVTVNGEYGEEVFYLSTFNLNNVEYTAIKLLPTSGVFANLLSVKFNPNEYDVYDGIFYRLDDNNRIADIIDVYNYEFIDEQYYRGIGLFSEMYSEVTDDYSIVNGECYKFEGIYHPFVVGFFKKAVEGTDYNVYGGKYYDLKGNPIENFVKHYYGEEDDGQDIVINGNYLDSLDGTYYRQYCNRYGLSPYSYVKVNGTFYKVVTGKETYNAAETWDGESYDVEKNSEYVLMNGKLYSYKDGIMSYLPVNLEKQPECFIDAQNVTKYFGGSERLVVTLKDKNNMPIANAKVNIYINGQPYTRTTGNDGVASMAINLNSGVYGVTTEYGGVKSHSTVTVKPTVVSNDFTKIFRNDTQYSGKFTDSQGNALKNADVKFNINGVFYTRKTNDDGIAKMNINLNPGIYVLTAENLVNGEQQSVTITVLTSIVENHDLTKYYKNDSQYRVRLLDAQGNPVGKGIGVEFNINGVFYTRYSDENGYVKMNINLNPGTYVITTNYNGLMASNTIKVLPIIKANDLGMSYRDGSKFEATLLDGQGIVYANQTVTFNINGVFYERTTDANGIARLNINLMAGEYIITSMYENGAALSNKVTISS